MYGFETTNYFRCEVLDYEKLFFQGQIEGMIRTVIDQQRAVCGGKNRNYTWEEREVIVGRNTYLNLDQHPIRHHHICST